MVRYGRDNMKPVINNETGVPDRLICIHCFVYIYFFNHTCCDAIYAKDLFSLSYLNTSFPGMILSIGAANERRRYNCTGWANTQKDPCVPLKKCWKAPRDLTGVFTLPCHRRDWSYSVPSLRPRACPFSTSMPDRLAAVQLTIFHAHGKKCCALDLLVLKFWQQGKTNNFRHYFLKRKTTLCLSV